MNQKLNILSCLVVLMTLVACNKNDQNRCEATDIRGLKGSSVAVVTGSLQDLAVSSSGVDLTLKSVNTPVDALTMVCTGKADYLVVDDITLLNVDLAQRGLKINYVDSALGGQVAFAFHKDSVALCQQYNAFFANLHASGLYEEMVQRWSSKCLDTVRMPQLPIPEGAPIEVAVLQADMPMSYIGFGDWAGFEVELLMRFGNAIGRPIHFNGYEFSAIIASLTMGKAVIGAGFMNITEERSQKVLFSDPFWTNCSLCASRDADAAVARKGIGAWVKEGVEKNLIQEDRWKLLVDGLWETLVISFWALIIGTLLGCVVCYLRMCRSKACNAFAKLYVDLMRGIPILVFLMIMFYVIFSKGGLSATWVAILAFSINLAAYVSEIFRSAVEGVDKGQWEAGWAMGFSRAKTFLFIVAPQAIRRAIPVYKNEAVSLIKNTSIVGYIAIQDLTKMSDVIRSRTFDAFFPLIVVTIIYFLLAWLLGLALDQIVKERRKP